VAPTNRRKPRRNPQPNRKKIEIAGDRVFCHIGKTLGLFFPAASATSEFLSPPSRRNCRSFFLTDRENSGSILPRIACVEFASLRVSPALLDVAQPSYQSEVLLLVSRE
jgi:hypothetical protein